MNHGGISRAAVLRLMATAHGRTSSYVVSGIGATPLVRWQFSHDRCRMGAISLVNVTARSGACPPNARVGARAAAMNPTNTIEVAPPAFGLDEILIVIAPPRAHCIAQRAGYTPELQRKGMKGRKMTGSGGRHALDRDRHGTRRAGRCAPAPIPTRRRDEDARQRSPPGLGRRLAQTPIPAAPPRIRPRRRVLLAR